VLIIVFSSPLRYFLNAKLPPNNPAYPGHKSIRKAHSDFGSYLGAAPHAAKVGIYRDVVLDLPDRAWIDDLYVRTELAADYRSASLKVHAELAGQGASLDWTLIDPQGKTVAGGARDNVSDAADLEIAVNNANLWWPRMSGLQNLYSLNVTLRDGQRILDRRKTTFGIRQIKPVLADAATGEKRFRFDINGRPIFLRGANWVPVEGITHVWQPQRAMRLLDMAEQANMNILRVWGEGVIPPQSFYDECDRRGILIWQDFMFGYYEHDPADKGFLDNCQAEIENTLRRLRNHPSILLWCGGNEQYLWSPTANVSPPKRTIFEQMMPEACKRLDPTRLFHTSSPYGGSPTGNWPLEGDWHDYTTINFTPEASVPLFGSEVLRVSVPPLGSMRRFLSQEDLWPKDFNPAIRKPGQPAWPPAWTYHSTGIATWDRVGAIQEYCDPASAEDLIRVIGTAHGEYLRDRIERQRRGVPDGGAVGNRRCWGNIVWRLNDSWPMIYSSVIDYYLEPKIAYDFLRRAYAPVLVSFDRTADRICVWVINDSIEPVSGQLVAQRLGFDGKLRAKMEADVSVGAGQAKRCVILTELGEISLRSEFLHASFAGQEATCLLIGERYLHLPEAHLNARVAGNRIEVTTDAFARQVTLQGDGTNGVVFEDNHFDLLPGPMRVVKVQAPAGSGRIVVSATNSRHVELRMNP
jgi:beta-mannosidase